MWSELLGLSRDDVLKSDKSEKLVDAARQAAYGGKFALKETDTPEQQAKTIDAFYHDQSATNLDVQKKALTDLVDAKMATEKQAAFHRYMNEFESSGFSGQEIAKTYAQLNMMLGSSFGVIDERQRVGTAFDFLYHAAEGHIDQGRHNTCGANVIEERVLARNPSLAAEMTTSAAVTGNWISTDGKVIKLDHASLQAGPEEQNCPPVDGWRSQSSQIFQVTALTDLGQHNEKPYTFIQKSQSSWSLVRDVAAWFGSHGESWRAADGTESKYPGLRPSSVAEENKRLLGDTNVVLVNLGDPNSNTNEHFRTPLDPQRGKRTELEEAAYQKVGVNTFDKVGGTNSLREKLADLKTAKQFPVMIGVDDFNNEMPASSTWFRDLDEGSHHVVIVKEYDDAHDRVYIQNSRGTDHNGWISVQDLYNGSL
jgi:hypothetical protein